MKAFGIESNDTMSIVDKFNEVGNRFAITSAGIGDALQRSASALFEGGNTLDEAIALITTANQVVQNPEVVGTAMKTLSLRLRSAKVDLESAGEDVDGMAESVSDLQKKLLALTGGKVDIMIDKDTFKSTTQILREMSSVWGEMTDANRSAALDLMGGKRQANTLAAIIKDFQTVEKVIETSSNSAGSALKENEVYLDSMQGRIDKLTNSMQSMWVNAMDSEVLKFFISVADVLVQATDKVGLFNVAIGLLMAKIAFSGKHFGIVNLLSKISGGAIAASGSINILGMSLTAGTTAFKLFNAAATMGLSLLAGLVIEGIIKLADELIVTSEEIKEAANQAQDAITSLASEFKQDAKTVSDYAERFAELAQGVDMMSGKNLSLTTDDYEEFLDLSNQLADIFPTLSRNYDENGNAIIQLSGDTDTMVGSLQALLDVQRQITNQKIAENLPDLYKGVKQQSDNLNENIDALTSRREAFQKELDFVQNINEESFNDLIDGNILRVTGTGDDLEALQDVADQYIALLEKMGLTTEQLTSDFNKEGEIISLNYLIPEFNEMTDEELNAAKQKITTGISELAETYTTEINNLNNEIALTENKNKANWSSLLSSIASWLSTDSTYQILDDNMQSVAQTVIDNLDYSSLDFKTWERAQEWIKNNILNIFTDSKIKDEATTELSKMFNLQSLFQSGNIDLGGYKKQISTFVDFVQESGLAEEVKAQLLKMFDIDLDEEDFLGGNVGTMLNHVKSVINVPKKEAIENELKRLGEGGTVGLLIRSGTLLSKTYSNENGTIAMNFTPVIVDENGKYEGMLTPDQLQIYAKDVIAGVRQDDLNLKIGATYKGIDAIEQAERDARTIVKLRDMYFNDNDEIPFDKLSYSDLQIINSDQFNVDNSVITSWEQLQYEIKQAKIAMTKDFTVNNFTDYADSINAIQENISTYQEALEKLESGSFTFTDFVELIQKFPDLAKGVDTSSKSFNGLSTNLKKAIKNSPKELIKELKNLKEQLKEAGKSTDDIDMLINSIENMPTDAVESLSSEYITLADAIDKAKRAQNELKKAMSENPNEEYETRADAIEQMRTLMEEGKIGSESELWDIATAFFGDNPEALAAIANKDADALYRLIDARDEWYAKDKNGNDTYDGTESFIGDVVNASKSDKFKKALEESGLALEDFKWSFEDGVLDFDFDNANFDKIVAALSQTDELAGLTAEEFRDLLVQVGQFFKVNWQDSDDLVWFLEQIKKESGSVSENLDDARNAVQSFLKSNGVDLDWLDVKIEDLNSDGVIDITISDEFKKLPEEVQKVLEEYYKVKQKFEKDPLGINFQLEKDSEINKEKGLTDNSLASINQLVSTARDSSTGVTWLSIDDLKQKAQEAGMDVDSLMGKIDELEKAGKIIDLKASNEDPFGLQAMQHDAETTKKYIESLGLLGGELDGAFTISMPSFIDTMIAAGWTSEQISAYITQLNSQGYNFTVTTETGEVQKIDLDTTPGRAKLDELLKKSDELTDTKDLTVNIDGTANTALKLMESRLKRMTSKAHDIKVNIKTDGALPEVNGTANIAGTAHIRGTACKNGSWGAEKSETALTGELGPELLVRGNRWTTIGENGAEFTQIKKGDIIFNHKQTEQLLKNGYVTGRGKAYASGTAYASGGGSHKKYNFDNTSGSERGSSGSSSASNTAKDQFEEIFDWIEVRLEEINEQLDLRNARLDNAIGFAKQNAVVDEMLDLNKKLYDNLIAGANKYYEYSSQLLKKIPVEYREAAQNGSIAIEEFVGKTDEKTLEAIKEYREWVQKGADATQQAEEVLTEISNLAKQAIDNISNDFGNQTSLRDSKVDQLDAYNALVETKYGSESENIYKAIIAETNKNIKTLQEQRNKMQAELNAQVKAGNIKKYSQNWYDAVNDIAAVDTEIINLTADTYNYQDSINELHWDHLDNLLSRFEAISDEADNLIDILGSKDLVDETGNWTKEGITSLGLYAQKMEVAEMQAKKYKDEINYLNKNWKKLGYTEQEYVEKLEELKEGQYDAIKTYNDTKDAIVDLNKERIDAIKDGIQKEIDAYEELINKKKEELDADKDAHDWQKTVAEKQKNISDIERKIAALSADNSASARAQRAKLEAELIEAQAELQETYYDRSITDQQNALDKELENFKENKDKEMEGWDEYLENTEQVVADSLSTVQTNTDAVYQTLKSMGKEYSLSIAESLTSPWKDGEIAIQSFSEKFGLSMSSTVEELQRLSNEFKKVMDEIEGYGSKVVDQVDKNEKTYQGNVNAPENSKPGNNTPQQDNGQKEIKTIKVGGKINAGSAKIYSYAGDKTGEKQYYSADPIYTVLGINGEWVQVRHKSLKSGVTGWFKKSDIKAYATGTAGVSKDQLALIDELGEELQLVPDGNGHLAYLRKGTAIIPHDISENLMQLGQLNPQDILDRNRPTISAPHITNNETVINIEYGDVLHIENFNGDKPEDLSKMIDKAFDKHMKDLNQQIRRYAR